eukprot:5763185-Pleurochrysis_carterae.AAC.1
MAYLTRSSEASGAMRRLFVTRTLGALSGAEDDAREPCNRKIACTDKKWLQMLSLRQCAKKTCFMFRCIDLLSRSSRRRSMCAAFAAALVRSDTMLGKMCEHPERGARTRACA